MRFCAGVYPRDSIFRPEEEGWEKVREPKMISGWLLAVPISLAMIASVIVAFAAFERGGHATRVTLVELIVIVIVTPVLHEALHLVAHPGFGTSQASVVGFWPKGGVVYVLYDGQLSRNRYLFIVALPSVVLTGGPLGFCLVIGHVPAWCAIGAVFNAFLAVFDILSFPIVLSQVPSHALVKAHGFDFYWRLRS